MKKSVLAPVLSAFVWGSGQFFVCKQRVKGLLFFAIQALLVGIELNTGYWIEWLTGAVPNFNLREHGGFFTHGIWG
ncbi:MAG: sugar ABC transporter permease, partial [Oscillospiraceae bacterium]